MTDLKKELSDIYRYRIELHAHTSPVSKCSDISPANMVETYIKHGYDAIVLTNHFTLQYMDERPKDEILDEYFENYEETRSIGQKKGLTVLLGTEIRFAENINDYLIYGIDRDILTTCYDYLEKGLEVFRKEVKLENSVFVQAHPFRKNMILAEPSLLDGIESFNMHPGHNSMVGLASRYAKEMGFKITTVGSDFHHTGHEAVSALRSKIKPETSFDIAKILKSGDYLFEIGENSIVIP